VFDWAWADAYRQHGIPYYPKWLAAIPFTPVRGARLLAEDELSRRVLRFALALPRRASSSLHVLFPSDHEADLMDEAGMMMRHGVQFHWTNPGYENFDAFLATLSQRSARTSAPSAARDGGRHHVPPSARGRHRRRGVGSSTAAIARPTASTTPRPT
jgi:predicted N-acyltransferase